MDKQKISAYLDRIEADYLASASEFDRGIIFQVQKMKEVLARGDFDSPTIKPGETALHDDLGEVTIQYLGERIATVCKDGRNHDVYLKDLKPISHGNATNDGDEQELKIINYFTTSNQAIEINSMCCPYCDFTFYELEGHELEDCPSCNREFNMEPELIQWNAETYRLILDHKTGIPRVILDKEYQAFPREEI